MLAFRRGLLVAVVLVIAASLLVACGDDGGTKPTATPTATPTETATEEPQPPDADKDGIEDDQDKCPFDAEDNRWTAKDSSDGCPDNIDDLLELARSDIDAYWKRQFQADKRSYVGPAKFVAYDTPISTACGKALLNNAFYCSADHSIYYHRAFLVKELQTNGDFDPVFIIAHEWGHLVQDLLGILRTAKYTIDTELQADCLAGVYAADADQREILEAGDLDEATIALLRVGDSFDTPFFEKGAHGTPGERIDSFLRGNRLGIDACQTPVHRN